MASKIYNSYPLVSTASLFLTLGAVMLFHFFFIKIFQIQILFVVSFMSLASKVKPKVLYLGGSVLINQAIIFHKRNYSFQLIGIGKSKWDSENYSVETQKVIAELKVHLKNKNKRCIFKAFFNFI